jgi:hypothetical protein
LIFSEKFGGSHHTHQLPSVQLEVQNFVELVWIREPLSFFQAEKQELGAKGAEIATGPLTRNPGLRLAFIRGGPTPASEDFGSFGAEWHAPSVFWFVGGTDPGRYVKAKKEGRLNEIPTNHNPRFAPVRHPTLQTGVEALIVATRRPPMRMTRHPRPTEGCAAA